MECVGDPLNSLIWANVIGILVVGAWMGAQAWSPARLVRLRNALFARRGTVSDFDWVPDTAPVAFRRETAVPSPLFCDAVARLDLGSCAGDWDRALRIAEHLVVHARDLGPIQRDLETTYSRILAGYGYCADFVKVFLGLSHAAGIFSRQWSFSHNGFGGNGHTIVEIFDRVSGKWFFLDVYNNFHVCDAATAAPLSALEFRDALLRGSPDIKIVQNGAGRPGYPIEEKLLAYFRRGLQEWYLTCGNAVFSYEANLLIRWSRCVSGALGQVVSLCLGKRPSVQVLATPDNTARVNDLMALDRSFRSATVAFAVLLLLLIGQLSVYGIPSRQGQ